MSIRKLSAYKFKLLTGALCIAVVAGFTLHLVARAEYLTGSDLFRMLRSPSGSLERATGVGYVMGVSDAGTGVMHCPPPNIRAGQISDVVASFIESRPELANHTADAFISNILNRAYPCLPDEKDMVKK